LALAACRAGATSVVTKLDRLAQSLPAARDILHELTKEKHQAQPRRLDPRPNRSVGQLTDCRDADLL